MATSKKKTKEESLADADVARVASEKKPVFKKEIIEIEGNVYQLIDGVVVKITAGGYKVVNNPAKIELVLRELEG